MTHDGLEVILVVVVVVVVVLLQLKSEEEKIECMVSYQVILDGTRLDRSQRSARQGYIMYDLPIL